MSIFKRKIPPSEIRLSEPVNAFYKKLKRSSDKQLLKQVKFFFDTLKEDLTAGVKIPHKLWPKYYKEVYGVTGNLWKWDLDPKHRATYTIIADGQKKIVLVIEIMDHKKYNKRFGYTV